MRRHIARLVSFSMALLAMYSADSQQNFQLKLNDSVYNISPKEVYQLVINGKLVRVQLNTVDTVEIRDSSFSFYYPGTYTISKVNVDKGVDQWTVVSAEGSGIIVQRYHSMNPTLLNEIMMSEITKEFITYGWTLEREDYSRKMASGQEMMVNKAVLRYKGTTKIIEVASIGKTDEGLLVVTMIMDTDRSEQGNNIIGLLWRSLRYE